MNCFYDNLLVDEYNNIFITNIINYVFYEGNRKSCLIFLNGIYQENYIPPPIILSRTVNICHPDSLKLNAKFKTEALKKEICKELKIKFIKYFILINEKKNLIDEYYNKKSFINKISKDNLIEIIKFL